MASYLTSWLPPWWVSTFWDTLFRRRFVRIALVLVFFSTITLLLRASIHHKPQQQQYQQHQPQPSPSSPPQQQQPLPPPQHREPFPPTHSTDFKIHDPSIIHVDNTYYSYSVGKHIVIHQAPHLAGPWTKTGTVLHDDSIIPKGDRKAPWAPHTIRHGDTYYCYYAVSNSGCRDSAIGVATSKSPGPGGWVDHGLIVQSGTGEGSGKIPFDRSNTIDPSVLIAADGQGYLNFGSFWSGIWQVPLGKDLISPGVDAKSQARHLVYMEKAPLPAGNNPNPLCRETSGGARPIEGSFISYHAPWYYLWFSYGKCCKFNLKKMPPAGAEYSIRVGRSKRPQGPFVDKQGRDLVDGGGEVVYGSNGDVYAPGGQGVLTEESRDILYYHYLNKTIGYDFGEARLGYNPLKYVDGWPVPQ